MNTDGAYYGDDRDLLESIYPTCTSFVQTSVPDSVSASIEIAFDPTNEEQQKQFSTLCYAYEDSYDWNIVPLVYSRSEKNEIIWRKEGSVIRRVTLEESVRQFDKFTNEITTA